jgi:hypothetical protein
VESHWLGKNNGFDIIERKIKQEEKIAISFSGGNAR